MSILKRGDRTYLVRVYMGRHRITKKRVEINETVRGSLLKAKRRETDLKAQKYSGRLAKSPRVTLNVLFEEFLNSARHRLEVTTYEGYQRLYEAYVARHLGAVTLDKLKPDEIQHFLDFLLVEGRRVAGGGGKTTGPGLGLALVTVRQVRILLRGIFKLAVDNGLVAENPAAKTRIPPCSDISRGSSLTVEEAKAFVSVKEESWYGIAFALQLHTGLRNQELMALIWDDVDFVNKTLRIERACKWVRGVCRKVGRTKTKNSDRVLELGDVQLALIRLQLEKLRKLAEGGRAGNGGFTDDRIDEWVRTKRPGQAHLYNNRELLFPRRDGGIANNDGPRLEFKRMLERAGIVDGGRKLRWYDLRHTHASLLRITGGERHEVAGRMGHTERILEKSYTHILPGRQRLLSQAFADLISI